VWLAQGCTQGGSSSSSSSSSTEWRRQNCMRHHPHTHTHSDLLHGSPSCWAGRRMWSSDACPCAPTFARTGGVRCTPHGWLPTAANPQQHLSPSIWCKLQQLVCVVAAQVWRACACPLSPPSCLPVWLGTRGSSQQHSRYLAPVAVGRSVCACWGPACLWLAVPG
jgi:hypothetical protein